MKKWSTKQLARAGVIAALYAALGYALGFIAPWLVFGPIQIRVSEVLTILPVFFIESVPALAVGCFIVNLLTGNIFDIIFGSLATLLAAILTRILKKQPFLAFIPPVLVNAIVVPLIFFSYSDIETGYWINFLTVGAGQAIVIFGLGIPMYYALKKLSKTYAPFSENLAAVRKKPVSTPKEDAEIKIKIEQDDGIPVGADEKTS